MSRETIFEEIHQERLRQDAKWGEQNHPIRPEDPEIIQFFHGAMIRAKESCDFHHENGTQAWFYIVREELLEVMDESTAEGQRAELVQLAAVAVSMIECIDRKKG